MGGKSRKSGGVSKALINRIKSGGRCCGKKKKPNAGGLLESSSKEPSDSK